MPALSDYYEAVGFALDDIGVYTSTAASVSTVTLPGLSNSTPGASANRYDGAWVWVKSGTGAGQQRQVRKGGYDPATGMLTVVLGWTAPSSSVVVVTRLFPISPDLGGEDASYVTLINRALSRLVAPDRVPLAFSGTTSAALTSYPWLDRPERLVGVLETAAVAGYPPVPCEWRGPRLVLDGPTPSIQINAPYTGSLILDVLRPGDTLINGLEATGGFLPGQDPITALPSVEDVRDVALAEAYWNLMNRTPGRPGGDWAKKWATQREIARSLTRADSTRERRVEAPDSGTPILQPSRGAA